MSIAVKRDAKPEPWNGRAVRCVVNHLIPGMKPYAGHATDKLVLINMARHAHPAGCGITVGKYAQADHLGCSDRRVWDAVKRLRRDGWIERTAQRTAERGSDTYRIVLCQRCSPPPAATAPPRRPAVSSEHLNRELQEEPSGTPVSSRSRPAAASPKGNHPERDDSGELAPPGSGGRSRPAPWNPPTGRRQAADAAFKPSNGARGATAGAVIPFKARPTDAGAPGGAARTQSRDPPSGATGEPVSNPRRELRNDLRN